MPENIDVCHFSTVFHLPRDGFAQVWTDTPECPAQGMAERHQEDTPAGWQAL